ncbi:MAG: hypothetical protein KGZ81_13730 [Flavobacteriales bacterium]|jgi:UDP-glucose 4-epimerase|nr:hypothetical protein [Flavobacteriales bacterium]
MADIRGKGTLYKGQYGWSVSQTKKDQHGNQLTFYIPVRFIKNALQRVADRKFIEFEGFTNHYKTKDGKTMTDYVITHIMETEYSQPTATQLEQSLANQTDEDKPLLNIDSDDLPF